MNTEAASAADHMSEAVGHQWTDPAVLTRQNPPLNCNDEIRTKSGFLFVDPNLKL